MCISNKFLGDTDAAGLRTTFQNHCLRTAKAEVFSALRIWSVYCGKGVYAWKRQADRHTDDVEGQPFSR